MEILLLILRISNLSLISLILIKLLSLKHIRAKIGIGMISSIQSFLLIPILVKYNLPNLLKYFLYLNMSLISVYYFLLSGSYFTDNFKMKKEYWILLFLKMTLTILTIFFNTDIFNSLESFEKVDYLRLLPNIFFSQIIAFYTIFKVYSEKQNDLIEKRILFRNQFIYLSGFCILWISLSQITLRALFPELIQLINLCFILLMIILFHHFAFDIPEDIIPKEKQVKEVFILDETLKEKLLYTMEIKKLYITEGLTIRTLALEMNEYEYKLRKLINEGLGYKNFNEFLNKYRVGEASELLLTTDLPVIRIAMDIGYSSLAPFNKAFKEITGMTPTEYRKKTY